MATARAEKYRRRREKARGDRIRPVASYLEPETWDAAAKVVAQTPPSVLGLPRSTFLLLLAGAADLAGGIVRSPDTVDELDRARATLGCAGIIAALQEGPVPKKEAAS